MMIAEKKFVVNNSLRFRLLNSEIGNDQKRMIDFGMNAYTVFVSLTRR